MRNKHQGFLYGVLAYFFWGFFPLFWPILKPAGTMEILTHRILWALAFVMLLLVIQGRASSTLDILKNRKKTLFLGFSAIAIAANWGGYIYIVNLGKTLDASLGYFIMPLISVLCGVFLFQERLNRMQWLAIGIAGVSVAIQSIYYGSVPWYSLALAVSFGAYGVFKKIANADAMPGMAIETAFLFFPALIYAIYLTEKNTATYINYGLFHSALLMLGGVVTVIPLIFLSSATVRVPLSTIGMLQYITPIIQFLIGWLVQGETMSPSRWAVFILVWIALLILTIDAVRTVCRNSSEIQSKVILKIR